MGGRVDSVRRVRDVATWWAQASDEQRRMFVQRFVVDRAAKVHNPKAPSEVEIQLGILLAESEQGTVEGDAQGATRALGERLRRG